MGLTTDQEGELIQRVYDRPIEVHKQLMEELEARFYPVEQPKKITTPALKDSVKRLVDQEMEKRVERGKEYDEKAYGPTERERQQTKLSQSEVDASVERLYTESLEHHKQVQEENNKRFLFDPNTAIKSSKKTIGGAEMKESAERLSVPKKMTYTIAEINKVYGLEVEPGLTLNESRMKESADRLSTRG